MWGHWLNELYTAVKFFFFYLYPIVSLRNHRPRQHKLILKSWLLYCKSAFHCSYNPKIKKKLPKLRRLKTSTPFPRSSTSKNKQNNIPFPSFDKSVSLANTEKSDSLSPASFVFLLKLTFSSTTQKGDLFLLKRFLAPSVFPVIIPSPVPLTTALALKPSLAIARVEQTKASIERKDEELEAWALKTNRYIPGWSDELRFCRKHPLVPLDACI